ncbi:MAG: methionine gamma-lyase family protein, partial [Clostridia bacterium]|nr:methionine gamma-lyase family protein [Clostridia bacterium]
MQEASTSCLPIFQEIAELVENNQLKILRAFQQHRITDFHLNGSTGYGYGDEGRDRLEKVYATVFKAEKALVRAQIVSGTHALALGLLGNLQRGEELLSATGRPYDTLLKVIGIHGEDGSLKQMGINYREIPLTKEKEINLEQLGMSISPQTKIVIFQRSKGYEWRPSFSIEKLAQAIKIIKDNFPEIICMVDNC